MTKNLTLHEQQLKDILDHVLILDKETYQVHGTATKVYHQQTYTNYVQSLADFGSHDAQETLQYKNTFIQHLCNTLYTTFYCGIKKEIASFKMPAKAERDEFMNKLSKSNYSTQNPDPNWLVYMVQNNGGAFAKKNGELRSVQPNTYVPNPQQTQLAVNQTIQFIRQKENREGQSVFYYVYGNEYLAPDCNMMRIYWNIKPEGAPLLIEQVTKVLNDYCIPFNFKCLNHPALYQRSDAAVLYFNKDNISIVNLLLSTIIEPIKAYLKEESPNFTTTIRGGVSIAEDPGNGQSFGMSRCMFIAEALYQMFEEQTAAEDKFSFLTNVLKSKGIDAKQMSINPHTKHYLLRV